MQYIYKGVVITSGDFFYLIIRKNDRNTTNGIPISNTRGVYDTLTRYNIQLVKVELMDGSESMELENILLKRPNFEDIFFKIIDCGLIEIFNENGEKKVDVWNMLDTGDPEFFTMFDELLDSHIE